MNIYLYISKSINYLIFFNLELTIMMMFVVASEK